MCVGFVVVCVSVCWCVGVLVCGVYGYVLGSGGCVVSCAQGVRCGGVVCLLVLWWLWRRRVWSVCVVDEGVAVSLCKYAYVCV